MDRFFGSFVWDTQKEEINIQKHGVDFETATLAFNDPQQVIAIDERNSVGEERLYCLGRVGGNVITVRFTYRERLIRIYGAGYWRKGRSLYEQKNRG